jgi:hypothetical protein
VLKPAVARLGDPESKSAASHVDLPPVEDCRERLFQDVGPEEGLIRALKFHQGLFFDIRQVPSALLKRPPRPLQRRLVARAVRVANFVSPCFVEGVLGKTLDMEAVEDQRMSASL